MKGSEKQIKWAEDIIMSAEAACNQIIRDAEAFECIGDATICRSGEEHAMECVGPEPCVYLAVVIVY